MKNILSAFIILAATLCAASCSDWTEAEAKDFETYQPDEAYYENLRAWKSTFRDREVSFGWFGGWTGIGSNLRSCLVGLPDSTDMISIWGPWTEESMTPEKYEDLRIAQEVKGIKVMACTFASSVSEEFGWDDNDESTHDPAIRAYARSIAEKVLAVGYDGLDIDHEPNRGETGNLVKFPARRHIFFEELGKYFGPESGTDKLLCIDGDTHTLLPETAKYIDFFIMQTYSYQGYAGSDERLDYQMNRMIDAYGSVMTPEEIASKFIVAEDFEKYTNTGGRAGHVRRDGTSVRSFIGFAKWEPHYYNINDNAYIGRKGGCGSYHMEYAYTTASSETSVSGFYPWLRESIQIMNPAQVE